MEKSDRPWGRYEVLAESANYKVKVITVFSGKRLSYQRHQRRAEHWFITNGTGVVKSSSSFLPTANATLNLGASGAYWATVYGQATTALYADLAENYTADAEYEPGTVVCFGGTAEVTQCNTDSCVTIAGVVSTNPAYAMNATCNGEFVLPIALQGRVPTKVTGNITKGDIMVSAGNGYAMACSSPIIGTVIGKSLENYSGQYGLIEIAIGRF